MAEVPAWLPPRWLPPVDAVTRADGTRVHAGCSYAIVPGYRPLQLDVIVPAASAPAATVIWVHGGGYAMGDRRQVPDPARLAGFFDRITAAGFALVSLDYRLGREAVFPAAVHDVRAAIRWLARYGADLGLDTQRVAIWGESAGAHLAGMAATTLGDTGYEGELGIRSGALELRAFVSWYGAMDLPTIVRPSLTPELEAAFGGNVPEFVRFPPEYFNLGEERWLDVDVRREASPLTHASAAMPPALFQHGDADVMVPLQQSEVMVQRLRELGCDVELQVVPGAGHVWQNTDAATVDGVIERALRFLGEQLA